MSTMPYFKLKNKTKQNSFFEKLFCSNKSGVKPITKNNLIKKTILKNIIKNMELFILVPILDLALIHFYNYQYNDKLFFIRIIIGVS